MCGWDKAARNWASTARSIIPLLCSSSGRSGRRVFKTNCWLVGFWEGALVEEVEVVDAVLVEELDSDFFGFSNSAAKAARALDSSAPVS